MPVSSAANTSMTRALSPQNQSFVLNDRPGHATKVEKTSHFATYDLDTMHGNRCGRA
jgi:hypothetical protein